MIELNKIYNENNCETMARMDDNSIDLTVTSPPYDNLRLYQGYSFNFERVAQELFRVTKEGGVVVWVVNDETLNGTESLTSFKQAIYFKEQCGFNLHDTMIWKKPGFSAVGALATRYAPVFEYMFVISKGKPKTFNPIKDRKNIAKGTISGTIMNADGTRKRMSNEGKPRMDYGQRFNIWEITQVNVNENHPAAFPEKLAQDHIISWSNEGEVVYDPFMGSGTVAKMCIKTNRNYVGSEISQEYCELAEKRILPYKQQNDLFYENLTKNST